jgi:hypothetical protein
LPGYKGKQRFLVTESHRFDADVRGNALQIEGRRRSEQIAPGTLGNVRKGQVQDFSLRHVWIKSRTRLAFTRRIPGLKSETWGTHRASMAELVWGETARAQYLNAPAGAYLLSDRRHSRAVQYRFDHGIATHA